MLRFDGLLLDEKVGAESAIIYLYDRVRLLASYREFHDPTGRIRVYADADELPVAVQFLDPKLAKDVLSNHRGIRSLERLLYGLLCKMIAFAHAVDNCAASVGGDIQVALVDKLVALVRGGGQ